MKLKTLAGLAVAALISLTGLAAAQTVPLLPTVGGSDAFQDIVGGVPTAQSQYVTGLTLSGYMGSLAQKGNFLIGGDATTNLFQRGTTGASVTTTLTYGGPDRFAYWSGTNTAMTVSRDSTAGDLPATNYQYAFKMARTAAQTGVVQMCMAQEIESVNVYGFQGQTAELDFHATAGANFSSAASALTAYIVTGTGTDQGLSTMAFAFNGGGGGSSTWTGQATTVADVATIGTTNDRYAAVGVIPAATTEIAVIFCYTPVGTAGANDYVALSGIQLTRNGALASVAPQAVAISCTAGTIQCSSYDRRLQATETSLQQRYFQAVTEPAASISVGPSGQGASTTTCVLSIPLPVTMRVAPTYASGGTALSASTWTVTHVVSNTALSTPFLAATASGSTPNVLDITATTTGLTAGQTCTLTGAAGGNIIQASAEL